MGAMHTRAHALRELNCHELPLSAALRARFTSTSHVFIDSPLHMRRSLERTSGLEESEEAIRLFRSLQVFRSQPPVGQRMSARGTEDRSV